MNLLIPSPCHLPAWRKIDLPEPIFSYILLLNDIREIINFLSESGCPGFKD